MPLDTKRLPALPDAVAPDGSLVRVLLRLDGGSMAHFELPAGQISKAVMHRTVEEIWFFLGGRGEMWRARDGASETIVAVERGVCLTVPVGTRFQFRSFGPEPLSAVGVTMPPWPGDGEAVVVDRQWGPLTGGDGCVEIDVVTRRSARRLTRTPGESCKPDCCYSEPMAQRLNVTTVGLLMCGVFVIRAQPTVPVVNGWHVLASFDAISGDRPIIYKDHPDLALAACSNCGRGGQLLVVTGQDIGVFDMRGTRLKQERTREFIAAAGVTTGAVNDPRATFDPFIRRWIVVCSCSSDFLIVSAGDDATGPWRGVSLSAATGDLTMFPGWDRNGVYVSEYQAPLNAQYIALPAADVAWRAPRTISLAHEGVFTSRSFEMRPAVDPNPDKQSTDPEYLVARSGPPQNAMNFPMELLVDRITWSHGQASVSGPHRVPTGFFYSKPIAVPQPTGPAVRGTESHRVFSVAEFERHLHVVVASGPCQGACGEQGADTNDLFFWFDIDTATMALHQKAKVVHPGLGFVFPTLAVDARGNVVMAATGGSREQPPSIYLASHRREDPLNAVNGPSLAYAGTSSYVCPNPDLQRREGDVVGWGTYSATVQDGSDPTKIWTVQEYGGSDNPCEWKTRVLGMQTASLR